MHANIYHDVDSCTDLIQKVEFYSYYIFLISTNNTYYT